MTNRMGREDPFMDYGEEKEYDDDDDDNNNNDNDDDAGPPPAHPPISPRSFMRRNLLRNHDNLTDDQREIVLDDLAKQGAGPSLMAALTGKTTWSRKLVEDYFSKWKWYNPNMDKDNTPDLSKGWAYFEHFTLPRRFTTKSGGADMRAPPGETRETDLYGVFSTSEEALSDWGIGMNMYFSSLSAVILIFLLAGLLNVANIIYYSSDAYDPGSDRDQFTLTNKMLKYSAICTDREWVVCTEGCAEEKRKWDNIFAREYYGNALDENGQEVQDENGNPVILINQTTCMPAQLSQGMINYGTMMLLILLMGLLGQYLRKKEVRFDEDNSTPSDYTVVVQNPPPDALEPDDWRDFFNQFSDTNKGVTLCTVALNNEELLAKLIFRRRDIKRLRRRFPQGADRVDCNFDVESEVDAAVEATKEYWERQERGYFGKLCGCIFTPLLRCLGFSLPEDVIWERIKKTTEEIRELQRKEYKAAAVYVTFETEEGQRNALEALAASELDIMLNRKNNVDPSAQFHEKILRVVEACEPNAVRWTDLNSSRLNIWVRLLITLGITLALIVFSAFILQISRLGVSTILFSVILTTFNSIIPIIVRLMVSYEKHFDEGTLQASLYLKITLFRWANTAIITRLITPLLVTLGEKPIDLINTINSLMISEMILAPMLRYLDPSTILNRHYFAPRANTEEELLSCFSGGWYNLAERFTDFTKVLLLCTFYSTFYPLIYFLGAAILFGQYWMDKFLLLRSWQKAPNVGTETARFSRTYFNMGAILLGAISSAFAYARSPYTLLCSCAENNKDCKFDTQGISSVNTLTDQGVVSIDEGISDEGYYFCDQSDITFPPHKAAVQGDNKWMTESQESLARIYGWTCFVLLIVYCVFVLGERVIRSVMSLVKKVYEPIGKNQHKDFSSGAGLESFGYIPQLEVPGFHSPMLICNIDGIDVKFIGWKDPNGDSGDEVHRSYDQHNLIFDVPHETIRRSRHLSVTESNIKPRRENEKFRPIYSVIKHYPPAWFREDKKKKNDQS